MPDSEIARTPLMVIHPDGRQTAGAVVIGLPTRAADGGWECGVALEGIEDTLPAIGGEDALQSLTLALTLAERLLRGFVARGGTLRDDEDNPWPLDAYFGRTPAQGRSDDGGV